MPGCVTSSLTGLFLYFASLSGHVATKARQVIWRDRCPHRPSRRADFLQFRRFSTPAAARSRAASTPAAFRHYLSGRRRYRFASHAARAETLLKATRRCTILFSFTYKAPHRTQPRLTAIAFSGCSRTRSTLQYQIGRPLLSKIHTTSLLE